MLFLKHLSYNLLYLLLKQFFFMFILLFYLLDYNIFLFNKVSLIL